MGIVIVWSFEKEFFLNLKVSLITTKSEGNLY